MSGGRFCSFSRSQGEDKKTKIDKYIQLARELKKLWIRKVKVIPIVVGVLGTVLNSLEKRLDETRNWREN